MSAMHTVKDMMGRTIHVPIQPKRIVSLVPSQTELLYDLGLEDEVVGITKFCVHPEVWFRNKKRIGGTKNVHIEDVLGLKPDLIIANREENVKEQIGELNKYCPVWVSDIQHIADALQMIHEVGILTQRSEKANAICEEVERGFAQLQQDSQAKRVAYFIWYEPWMSIGHDTFIHEVIERMGWTNVLADMQRYPEIDIVELAKRKPELVLLSSEPYPFKEKHVFEIQAVLPETEVKLVDGEMFSWYGSRMLKAIDYLQELIKE
ncbi:MAG: helical backbone metal receptor [Bacteroidota bacterium]